MFALLSPPAKASSASSLRFLRIFKTSSVRSALLEMVVAGESVIGPPDPAGHPVRHQAVDRVVASAEQQHHHPRHGETERGRVDQHELLGAGRIWTTFYQQSQLSKHFYSHSLMTKKAIIRTIVWPLKMKSPQYFWVPLRERPPPAAIVSTRDISSEKVIV